MALVILLLMFVIAEDYRADAVLASLRGHGILSSRVNMNPFTGENEIQCQKTPKTVKLEHLRDGLCDCSEPAEPCVTPGCTNCQDATDELCSEGKTKCLHTGACLDDKAMNDRTLNCPWDCIEEVPLVREECRLERHSEMAHLPDLSTGICEPKGLENAVVNKLCNRGLPFDCVWNDDDDKDDYCGYLERVHNECCTAGDSIIPERKFGIGNEYLANDVRKDPSRKVDALWKHCSPSQGEVCPKTPF